MRTPISRRPQITARLASGLGMTRGEASTLLVGVCLASVLALGGLPPVLRGVPVAPESSLGAPAAQALERPARAAPNAPPTPTGGPAPWLTVSGGLTPTATSVGSGTGSHHFISTPSDSGRSGVTRPVSTVTGKVADVKGADGITSDREHIYVASNDGSSASKVVALRADGSSLRSYTVTGQPADRTAGVTGLVLDGGGVLALDASTGRILRIDLSSGDQRTYARLPDLPACELVVAVASGCEPGVHDAKPAPSSAVFAKDGTLFVTDSAQGTIWRVPPRGGQPEVLTNDVAFAGGNGVSGIAIADDGTLLVASPEAIDAQAAAGGAVYRVTPTGTKTLIARFPRGEAPAGVAVAPDGTIAVALPGAGAVAFLDQLGAELRRQSGEVGGVTLTAPRSLAYSKGALLVTDGDQVFALATT